VKRAIQHWLRATEPWYFAVGLANLVLGTSSVLVPLLISRVLSGSVSDIGILSGMVSLAGVVGSLIWGRLSDRAHRRKPFIVLSYLTVGLMLGAMSISSTLRQLLSYNMLLNLFWVANASVTVLIVIENRDSSDWELRIGHLNQIGAMGWVAGLALGSLAMAVGPAWVGEAKAIRGLFILIAGISLTASVLALRWVPRTMPRFTQRRFRGFVLAVGNFLVERARFAPFHLYHRLRPRRILRTIRDSAGFRPGIKRFLGVTFLAFLGLGLFGIPLTPLLSERFGLPSSAVFFYFTLQHLAIVAAYPLVSRRIKRRGNRWVQFGAIVARMILFGGCSAYLAWQSVVPPTWALVAVFLIYGISWSFFQLSGVALTSRLAKPENRGMALGLYNALAGMAWIAAGLLGGPLAERWGYETSSIAATASLAAALILLVFVPDPPVIQETAPHGSEGTGSS